mgnify:CR=1 FL=1
METAQSLTAALQSILRQRIAEAHGWLGFDRFMEVALYTPGLGYYARGDAQFGVLPAAGGGGGDFVTAPEISRFFGQALAAQVGQALQVTNTREVWEFGAGSGALAAQLLGVLGPQVERYTIVDLSASLQQRQRETLRAFGDKVRWASSLPARLRAVVLGNEVLDAMPVQLVHRVQGVWHERGVALIGDGRLGWADRPTALRPPLEVPGEHDYLTEVHPRAEGFVRMLADHLEQGAVFLIDYGFSEREYYHVQRSMGTVMCHRGHRMDADPLADVGHKDITAHVNFTGLALAAQDAEAHAGRSPPPEGSFGVLGYTTQARFLMNCGLLQLLEHATVPERVMGDSCGCLYNFTYATDTRSGKRNMFGEVVPGGIGATATGDGMEVMACHVTNCHIPPIEAIEMESPVLYLRREMRCDSGGHGRFRGGVGQVLAYRVLGVEAKLHHTSQKSVSLPQGVFGGLPGDGGRWVINEGLETQRVLPFAIGDIESVAVGDTVTHFTPGGGGYGAPGQRDAAAVARDVLNELVSAQVAAAVYGWTPSS